MTQLSPQQQQGIQAIKTWYDEQVQDALYPTPFRFFGAAGTGKTTLAKAIGPALGLDKVVFGTFTGKAAHVLRSKGAAPVSTIHSAVYFPTTDEDAKAKLEAAQMELNDTRASLADLQSPLSIDEPMHPAAGNDIATVEARIAELEVEVAALTKDANRMTWEWNPESEWASADLIILDEVSMVNHTLARDVERYEVPVLVLGDPAQLPPVDGGGYYTNAKPDFELTEVHRQALESPVLALATRVRLSTDYKLGITGADMRAVSLAEAMEHDQVICWSNKKRWNIINAMRRKMGRPEGEPVAGDRIMCLTNNKDLSVFNGQQFTVLASAPAVMGPTLTVLDDEGHERVIPTYADGFMGREMQDQAKNSGAGLRGRRMLATFAQAITCHKAQGSQWGTVYVVNELDTIAYMGAKEGGRAHGANLARRWLYTALTRAESAATLTAPTGRR